MVLKKIEKMTRHFAEPGEGDRNANKTAPKLVNSAETCTETGKFCRNLHRKNASAGQARPGTVLKAKIFVSKSLNNLPKFYKILPNVVKIKICDFIKI